MVTMSYGLRLALVGIVAGFLASCGSEAPEPETEPVVLVDKASIISWTIPWLYLRIDHEPIEVWFVIREDALIAADWPIIGCNEETWGGCSLEAAAFRIHRHIDLWREISDVPRFEIPRDPIDGPCGPAERFWNERQFMEVDWTVDLLDQQAVPGTFIRKDGHQMTVVESTCVVQSG